MVSDQECCLFRMRPARSYLLREYVSARVSYPLFFLLSYNNKFACIIQSSFSRSRCNASSELFLVTRTFRTTMNALKTSLPMKEQRRK